MKKWAVAGGMVVLLFAWVQAAAASDAPQWMHSLVNVPLPAYDEKTDAVLLYSEINVTVVSADKIKTHVREAYRILRPGGRRYGTVPVYLNPHLKLTSLRGWCIPAKGGDFEVRGKDAAETSLPDIKGSELITDVRVKLLHIPAPDPGNLVGYELDLEEQPFVLQDGWPFQELTPVREARYSLQLPPGWEYKVSWLNHPEVAPTQTGGSWHWVLNDVPEIRREPQMPPWRGVAGEMILTFFPPGGATSRNAFAGWPDLGNWYSNLLSGRMDASGGIKGKVAELTASKSTSLDKMRAIAQFVQHDIRYVAIELGIGGWQPHPAADVFANRYGDCKDKATLMRSMLGEIGIESYHVTINTQRGAVTPETPAHLGFNHAILALKLPDSLRDPSLVAVLIHPKLGRILFFDPTDPLTPFGQIPGALQSNYGLLVTPKGGELVELPEQASIMNSIQRTAKLTLDPSGRLKGDVKEVRLGDRAWTERMRLLEVKNEAEKVKPIETLLAGSLPSFRVTKANIINLHQSDQPFGFDYSFEADHYAKTSGDLLLVRPRVIGNKSLGFLESKEPRRFPVEFESTSRDTDTFEIAIPAGYEVDDLPPAVDADYSFASYHSKIEASGGAIRYTRTFEVKELTVPVSKSEELKRLYRTIAADERNTAVLRPAATSR